MENHDKCACKCLIAYYKEKGYALGTKFHEFYVEKNKTFHVEIDQYVGRSIKISAKSDTPLDDLYDILDKTEKILMLFEGRFIHLNNIVFSDSDTADDETLNQYAQETLKNRLNYFSSADFCKGSSSNLIDYKTVLTTEMYKEWEALLDELNSSYQVFLYAICDNKMTIDINCAFLYQAASRQFAKTEWKIVVSSLLQVLEISYFQIYYLTLYWSQTRMGGSFFHESTRYVNTI